MGKMKIWYDEEGERTVEIAIEKDEDTAIKWLQKQTKEAGA